MKLKTRVSKHIFINKKGQKIDLAHASNKIFVKTRETNSEDVNKFKTKFLEQIKQSDVREKSDSDDEEEQQI